MHLQKVSSHVSLPIVNRLTWLKLFAICKFFAIPRTIVHRDVVLKSVQISFFELLNIQSQVLTNLGNTENIVGKGENTEN